MKFWQFLHTIQSSLLKVCSPRSVLRSVFFLDSNHCKTAYSSWSSFWAATQSVTCLSTRTHLVATHTSFFFCWLPLITVGFFSFHSLGSTYGCSIQDGLHGLLPKTSGNLAQCICHCIISSFLVFQLEIEFC